MSWDWAAVGVGLVLDVMWTGTGVERQRGDGGGAGEGELLCCSAVRVNRTGFAECSVLARAVCTFSVNIMGQVLDG